MPLNVFNTVSFTRKEAADKIGMSVRFLESLASKGIGPKYFRRDGNKVFYREEALKEWWDEYTLKVQKFEELV